MRWMVDGGRGGAGSCGLGWSLLDGVLPLTLTHSPVSRLSRWLGWPRPSGGESRRTTPPYHHMHRTHHAPRMHVSASCDPPAVHACPQRPCGDLALASARMSSPLTLLTLSPTNPLLSGALMLTGMMGFERHERIGCGWDGTASVTRSDDALKGGALYLSSSTATVSGAKFTSCLAVRR